MDYIVIGFSRPKKWSFFSWAIRLLTQSPFSHAYVRYYNSYADRWEIFQASGLKTNFIGHVLFEAEEEIYQEFEIEITEESKIKVVQFCIDNCGKPYGIMEIVGIGYVLLMRAFKKQVNNPFENRSTFFCSEMVEVLLNEILEDDDDLPPSCCTPKDLYDFLVSRGIKTLPSD